MLYALIRNTAGLLARAIYRPAVIDLHHVPRRGPVILAVNHLSAADSIVVPLVVPRPVAFLAKAEYFQAAGVRGAISRWTFRSLGAIPVQRGQGRSAREALTAAERVLADGGAFGIHPEGTRSPDGRLYRGHTGVARLALERKAPVVPVALSGTDRLLPIGKKLPRIRPVTVRFGAPLDFSRYAGMESSLAVLRSVTDEIMYALSELSGQEYVDLYQRRSAA